MNLKTKRTWVLWFLILLVSSCSALKKQQKIAVKQMAVAGKTYSLAPKELLSKYSDCLYRSDKLEASMALTQVTVIADLDSALQRHLRRKNFTDEINTSYKLLEKYFQALLSLADVDSADKVKTNIGALGVNIDSLISKSSSVGINSITTGFGTIAGELVKYAGKRYVSHRQVKFLKQFTNKGQVLIDKVSAVMRTVVIDALVKPNLNAGNTQYNDIFLRYINSLDSTGKKPTPSAFQKDLNSVFLDIKSCYGKALVLTCKLDSVTQRLSAAHSEMLDILNNKTKKPSIASISAFIEAADDMADFIKQINETEK